MRSKLLDELVFALIPYKNEIPIEDLKAQMLIILDGYEISQRHTEVAIRHEEKNQRMLRMFLASKAASGRTDNTIKHYKNSLEFIFDRIGKDFDEITADDIKLYLARRLRVDHVSKTTAANERRNLSALYTWLYKNEYLRKNPMNKVEAIKYAKPKKKAFTDMEIEKLRLACRTEREKMVVEVLLSTWCRVSELAGIRLDEIEGDKVLVHGKGEKDRTVYLNAKAQIAVSNYLSKRKDSNPYLLPKAKYAGQVKLMSQLRKGKPAATWYESPELVDEFDHTDKGTIEFMIRNIGKSAAVKNSHPHRFRRTGATFALRSGMNIMTVSKLLGHANIAVTQVYLDIDDEELEDAHGKYVR